MRSIQQRTTTRSNDNYKCTEQDGKTTTDDTGKQTNRQAQSLKIHRIQQLLTNILAITLKIHMTQQLHSNTQDTHDTEVTQEHTS